MIELSVIRDLVAIFGVIAGFTYYVLTVRNSQKNQKQQLETRQAQLLMQTYSRLDTPDRSKAITDMLTWEFKDFQDFLNKSDPVKKPEEWSNIANLVIYFEGIGTLVKEGYIDISKVATLTGGVAVNFWSKIDPIVEDIRKYIHYPRWASETEYLYNELLKYAETHPDYKI